MRATVKRAGGAGWGVLIALAAILVPASPATAQSFDTWLAATETRASVWDRVPRGGVEARDAFGDARAALTEGNREAALAIARGLVASEAAYDVGRGLELLWHAGARDEMVEVLRRCDANAGMRDEPGVAHVRALLDAEAGRYLEGARGLLRATRFAGSAVNVTVLHANAAELLVAAGELDEAIALYRLVLAQDGGHVHARYGLAAAYMRQGDVEAARRESKHVARSGYGPEQFAADGLFFVPAYEASLWQAIWYEGTQQFHERDRALAAWEAGRATEP